MIEINNCPFCKSTNSVVVSKTNHQDKYLSLINEELNSVQRFWKKCKSCNFLYKSPVITIEESEVLYSKYRSLEFTKITPNHYFDKITSYSKEESESYKRALFLQGVIGKSIESILDVGCGGGIFLYHLKSLYPSAYLLGLEPNTEYSEMVRRKLGIPVKNEYYKVESVNRSFDLTIATGVLEHIHDLKIFWKAAYVNVNTGRYVFIEVPSELDFQHLPPYHDVFESPHLYFFQKIHMKQLAEEFSFYLLEYTLVKDSRDGRSKQWFVFVKK